jgi:hypothetical protein
MFLVFAFVVFPRRIENLLERSSRARNDLCSVFKSTAYSSRMQHRVATLGPASQSSRL